METKEAADRHSKDDLPRRLGPGPSYPSRIQARAPRLARQDERNEKVENRSGRRQSRGHRGHDQRGGRGRGGHPPTWGAPEAITQPAAILAAWLPPLAAARPR